MSKNDRDKKDDVEEKKETPEQRSKRAAGEIKTLTVEIIAESKKIADGLTESCYTLVQKTKKLQFAESEL